MNKIKISRKNNSALREMIHICKLTKELMNQSYQLRQLSLQLLNLEPKKGFNSIQTINDWLSKIIKNKVFHLLTVNEEKLFLKE